MRTSVTGCSEVSTIPALVAPASVPARMPALRGHTLLEMLVALFILALGISAAVLALRPNEARILAGEADRLALLLEQAREESALGGMPLAWVAREDGYEFQRREVTESGPQWSVVRGDDLLRPRALPTGMVIRRIDLDGQVLSFGERVPLGLANPQDLAIEISLGGARTRVVANPERATVAPLPAENPA